jgi:hypothetical protein
MCFAAFTSAFSVCPQARQAKDACVLRLPAATPQQQLQVWLM